MERGSESVLDTIFHDPGFAGTLDEGDVEMLDAEALEAGCGGPPASSPGGGALPVEGGSGGSEPARSGRSGGRSKKRNRRKKKGGSHGDDAFSASNLNRFVIKTCRHLREHKSYLVWNAIGCLGVSAVRDLVKEVDAIQSCGGQKTVDGRRFRSGGGILWNILKTREPKVYKEIMAKGKEIEKQLKIAKPKTSCEGGIIKISSVPDRAPQSMDHTESGSNIPQHLESSDPMAQCRSLLDRMRIPVSYDDLLEEGEIP